MSIGQMIDELGGPSKVADALGIAQPVVSMWKLRGRLPAERWAGFVRLAKAAGVKSITLERLADMHSSNAGCAR